MCSILDDIRIYSALSRHKISKITDFEPEIGRTMPECLKAHRVRILSSPGRRYCEYRYQTLEGTGDEHLHDLIGPAIDALDASILIHLADRIFSHVAVAAEQLQALIDDLALQVADPVLGH